MRSTRNLLGEHLDATRMPGHRLLARLGKRVLRPGGLELTPFRTASTCAVYLFFTAQSTGRTPIFEPRFKSRKLGLQRTEIRKYEISSEPSLVSILHVTS